MTTPNRKHVRVFEQPAPPKWRCVTGLFLVIEDELYAGHIWERPSASREWRTLRLVITPSPPQTAKKSWWLGWNGHRFSNGNDFKDLQRRYPDLVDRLLMTIQASDFK